MTTRLPTRKLSEVLKRAPVAQAAAAVSPLSGVTKLSEAKNLYDLNISLTNFKDFYHLDPFPFSLPGQHAAATLGGGVVAPGGASPLPFASNKTQLHEEKPPPGLPGVNYDETKEAKQQQAAKKKPKPGTRRNLAYAEEPSRKWSDSVSLWTIYKPPFVPRKAWSATLPANHEMSNPASMFLRDPTLSSIQHESQYDHGISVEAYLKREAALQASAAREVAKSAALSQRSSFNDATLRRLEEAAESVSNLSFSVPFDMDDRASGCCLVMVGSGKHAAQGVPSWLIDTLRQGTMISYDILVHGHHKKSINDDLSMTMLFPKKITSEDPWEANRGLAGTGGTLADLHPTAKYSVYSHGYYGPYPVSKVGVTITCPIACTRPNLRTFVSSVFNSHIVGETDTSLFGAPRASEPETDEKSKKDGEGMGLEDEMDEETLKELRTEQRASEVGQAQAQHNMGTAFPRYMVHCRGIQVYDTLSLLEDGRKAVDNTRNHPDQTSSNEQRAKHQELERGKAQSTNLLKTVLSSSCLRALPELGVAPQPLSHIRIRDGRWHPLK